MIPSSHSRQLAAWLLVLVFVGGSSEAQSRKLTGQVFAYNPWSHLFKVSSFVQNQELVIFKLKHRPGFVKLVFASFGQEQLDGKYLKGNATIAVRVIRDVSCDQDAPKFFAKGESLVPPETPTTPHARQVKLEQKYQVTDFYSKDAIPQIEHLDCYRVEMPRK